MPESVPWEEHSFGIGGELLDVIEELRHFLRAGTLDEGEGELEADRRAADVLLRYKAAL